MNSLHIPRQLLGRRAARVPSRRLSSVAIAKQTTSRPLQRQPPSLFTPQQPRRHFQLPPLSSLFPSSPSSNNNNNNSGSNRNLTATRILPFPPTPLFRVISSVESYSEFLPFLSASTVTARDPSTGYPTRAYLTVGYGPFSETFTSRVDCDAATWVVEARSGAGFDKKENIPGADEGIFEYLDTRWQLMPLEGGEKTKVQLDIRFKFRNQFHATMMSAVEGQMAQVMIEAFEKRIREVVGSG
ncbi:sreptomyces cyclase/dehydrase family protein [Paecilomyces variotii No. 5]|uniref:Sreptomyces cyclase/dehydrase family protein n=1 Tax=Byssochlamys spectabilis (strain No. 5 / NBRC 109023) TaxID=1356009 RepID=V5HV02_BYSSN|nr:sreptomyces cyclase/dehydrase family protein [Paecilomyces variotii No. 5]